jgi:hypothetical protein
MQRFGHPALLVFLSTSLLPAQLVSQNQFPKAWLSGGYPHEVVRKAIAAMTRRRSF